MSLEYEIRQQKLLYYSQYKYYTTLATIWIANKEKNRHYKQKAKDAYKNYKTQIALLETLKSMQSDGKI